MVVVGCRFEVGWSMSRLRSGLPGLFTPIVGARYSRLRDLVSECESLNESSRALVLAESAI
jgi:hypothetical protein